MATTGILRPDEVIFYHPLDSDFKEHTVAEVWSGTASSVVGKILQGESAITSSDIALGARNDIEAGSSAGQNQPVAITALSATSVVATYPYRAPGGDDTIKARAGTVSGTTVTWGAANTLSSVLTPSSRALDVDALDSTHVIFAWHKSTGSQFARVGTVSGLDITFGAENLFSGSGNSEVKVAGVDSTHAVVFYRGTGGKPDAKVCTVSGMDVTFGAESEFNSVSQPVNQYGTNMMAIIGLTSTTVVGATSINNYSQGASIAKVGTLSGTDITWGASTATDSMNPIDIAKLTATKFVFVRARTASSSNEQKARVGVVSGTDITFGAAVQYNAGDAGAEVAVEALSSTTVAVTFRGNGVSTEVVLGTVSGMDITFAAATVIFAGNLATSPRVASLTLTADNPFAATSSVLLAGIENIGNAYAFVGTLDTSAGLSGTSASYPSAIGATRVTMAMWARNLTAGGSTVTVERGYSVTMTATMIALGGTTATWSGAGIATLMGAGAGEMNDDADHLLVLDFENTGGTDWTLRTSVDGAAFTSQGTQTSGTQAVTTADTDPSAVIADGSGATQWIDELVMWAGDKTAFEPFETQELANLNDLADVFGETMDQFEENFGAPLCWQATATMLDGSVWRDSGGGPCPPVIRVPAGAEDVVVTDDGRKVSPRVIEG